ncbi:hypothetical protein ANO14919_023140 [Xylariales sp. No.14919]|nr:hypothetical protein ANO14919_023140 [Xylariales sp. No.14919]
MGSIYEGALLVIAATAASDSTRGCLFEREPHLEIQATIQGGAPFSVFARKTHSHSAFTSNLHRGEPIPEPVPDERMSRVRGAIRNGYLVPGSFTS